MGAFSACRTMPTTVTCGGGRVGHSGRPRLRPGRHRPGAHLRDLHVADPEGLVDLLGRQQLRHGAGHDVLRAAPLRAAEGPSEPVPAPGPVPPPPPGLPASSPPGLRRATRTRLGTACSRPGAPRRPCCRTRHRNSLRGEREGHVTRWRGHGPLSQRCRHHGKRGPRRGVSPGGSSGPAPRPAPHRARSTWLRSGTAAAATTRPRAGPRAPPPVPQSGSAALPAGSQSHPLAFRLRPIGGERGEAAVAAILRAGAARPGTDEGAGPREGGVPVRVGL